MLAVAGCSSSFEAGLGAPADANSSAYQGAWSLDQIVQFDSEQTVIGTIVAIGPEYKATIDDESAMRWVPVTIRVVTATPELKEEQFVARVLPDFDGQPDLTRLEVGGYVLYLGDAAVHDVRNSGPEAGTVSWLLTIDDSGRLGATAPRDTVEGNVKDYAAELGVSLPKGLFTGQ